MRLSDTIERRFLAKVSRLGECWDWTASRANGYGVLSTTVGGSRSSRRIDYAHRIAWRLHRGEIPRGMQVLHQCDNRGCVRPSHLFLGTVADNMADKVAKKRQSRGETHGASKLTDAKVRLAREMRAGGATQREIAERVVVSRPHVSMVLAGKRWKS